MASVGEVLRRRAAEQASDRAFVFLDNPTGGPAGGIAVSYAELDSAARRVAAAVSARGVTGRPVLLLYPPGRGYVEGFFGCLYAGAIAVPAYPPDPTRLARTLPRLRALAADCGARLALGPSELVDAVPALAAEAPELAAVDWIATDTLEDDPAWAPPVVDPGSRALLQYTSGSTGTPKGVLLSHANLVHNAELVRIGFGTSPHDVGVSWLPPYHDMGLVGGIVQPVYAGLPTVLMSPLTFLQRPLTWLEAVSRFGATVTGGPNFAFDLCVRKTTPQQRAALDLSRWAVAFCGAEPVRADTLRRFSEAFEPAGFRPEAFYPCYGLAEATLIVTGGRRGGSPRPVRRSGTAHGGAVHVGCGAALGDQRVVVVDPDTRVPCAPGTEGEIWVSGGSVALGYWNRPAETEETFGARLAAGDRDGRYLRTGDLGILDEQGELAVTGRIKDLVIVRGRNVHPQDLEHAVEQRVPGVRPGCSAAFATEAAGEERVAIACEVAGSDPARVLDAIRQVLAETAEISPAAVVLLRPRTIPKTSSGKIQRHACRNALATGTWDPDVIARWPDPSTPHRCASKYHHCAENGPLTTTIAGALGLPPEELAADAPLTRLGLDSLRAVELRHALHERTGLDVPLSELLAGITVAELTARAERAGGPADDDRAERAGGAEVAGRATGAPAGVDGSAAPLRLNDGQRALWLLQRWARRTARRTRSPGPRGSGRRSTSMRWNGRSARWCGGTRRCARACRPSGASRCRGCSTRTARCWSGTTPAASAGTPCATGCCGTRSAGSTSRAARCSARRCTPWRRPTTCCSCPCTTSCPTSGRCRCWSTTCSRSTGPSSAAPRPRPGRRPPPHRPAAATVAATETGGWTTGAPPSPAPPPRSSCRPRGRARGCSPSAAARTRSGSTPRPCWPSTTWRGTRAPPGS